MVGESTPTGTVCRSRRIRSIRFKQRLCVAVAVARHGGDASGGRDGPSGARGDQNRTVLMLNGALPGAPENAQMWRDVAVLQQGGVKVLGMFGGPGRAEINRNLSSASDAHWDSTFEQYYPVVKAFLQQYRLDGIDLFREMKNVGVQLHEHRPAVAPGLRPGVPHHDDLAAPVPRGQHGAGHHPRRAPPVRLVQHLRSRRQLDAKVVPRNGQRYCGVLPRTGVVLVALTGPPSQFQGMHPLAPYFDTAAINATVLDVRRQHPQLTGIAGWEYSTMTAQRESVPVVPDWPRLRGATR